MLTHCSEWGKEVANFRHPLNFPLLSQMGETLQSGVILNAALVVAGEGKQRSAERAGRLARV